MTAALWLVLFVVLFSGFLALAGFDYGAGMLLPFVARTDEERRDVLNALGVFLLGNEVWLLVSLGALLGTLPGLAASLLAGAGPLLVAAVIGTVLMTVSVQLRSRPSARSARRGFDVVIALGGLVAAFGWAAITTRFAVGADGGLLPEVLGGLAGVSGFAAHGAAFLAGRTTGAVEARARRALRVLPAVAAVLLAAAVAAVAFGPGPAYGRAPVALVLAVVSVAALLAATGLRRRPWRAFAATAVAVGVLPTAIVAGRGDALVVLDGRAVDLAGLAASPAALAVITWTGLPVVLAVVVVQVLVWRSFGGRLDARSPRFY